ncbi:hypothetical protein Tco_0780603 [Tanacetum coccineum]
MTAVEISQTALKHEVSSLRQDTSEIKSMITEIYNAFKGQSYSAPSSSVTSTLALTNIPANVDGGYATNTATEEPPSHTERETEDPNMAILISSIQPTEVPPTQAQPITTITTHPESSQAAPIIDKGKGIATESDEDPLKKLVSASTTIRPDPDEKEKLKKAAEEVRLFAISKPKVIKVVQEETKKIGLDPKKIASSKAERNKKRAEQYMWTMTNRIKPKPITDVKIHPNTKPDVLSVYRNNDKRKFDVNNPFKFIDFGITELDELGQIIQKKKNSIVKDLMTSLSKRYERPKIKDKDSFELKGQFLKELRDNTFSGLDHEDANEHIEKVFEIVDLFHILNITIDQVMLRASLMYLTGVDLTESKEIDEVGEVSIIWNLMCDCSRAGIQTHLQYTSLLIN